VKRRKTSAICRVKKMIYLYEQVAPKVYCSFGDVETGEQRRKPMKHVASQDASYMILV
jgi:hypothetical protein